MWFSDVGRKRRLRNMLLIIFVLQIALMVRIGFIQFVQGTELQAMAYSQQTLNRSINPKRGRILDRTGKVELAVSASTETVSVNPTNIPSEKKEKLAEAMANIFDLDYEKVLKRLKRRTSIEIITKKVDKEKTDKLRVWLAENNITTGVNIDEDTKRYYPNNNLAAQIIGFCGSDNQGLDGIEAKYEDDEDYDNVILQSFDLALRKWVTQAIVIENGKETVTETGHKAEDNPEQVVKVEINRKKLNSVTVKFRYSIRVTNEGDIAGYAKEVTDYIPEGLKFDAKDNPDWNDEGNNITRLKEVPQ